MLRAKRRCHKYQFYSPRFDLIGARLYRVRDRMVQCSWIYSYICNQCLSTLKLWVRIPLRLGVLDTTLGDKVCQWLATGRWLSPVSFTDRHDVTEIILKVALNAINQTKSKPSIYHTRGKHANHSTTGYISLDKFWNV